MIDSTNPRSMADNIRYLSGASESQASDISDLDTAVGTLQTTVGAQGNAIGALQTFSTDEVDTGMKWIDDSNIYRKVIPVETFPNNTTQNVQHGIDNLGVVTCIYGIMLLRPGVMPGRMFVGAGSPQLTYSSTVVTIGTSSDMSSESGFIIMEYTKTAPESRTSPSPEDDTRSIEPEEIPEDEYIEPEVIEEAPEEEPVQEVKKTTRKKSTN